MSGQIVLLVDAGNSAIKHCLVYCPAQTAIGVTDSRWQKGPIRRILNTEVSIASLVGIWREEIEKFSLAPSAAIGMSWSCVGPVAIQEMIAAAYQELAKTAAPAPELSRPYINLSGATCRYENAYRDAAQLGADRWISGAGLAALGVMDAGESHLVVSAGTATTFDLLFKKDSTRIVFQGGWILPGIRLMHEGLRGATRQLDYSLSQALADARQIPRDSQSAIEQGLGLAQTVLIRQLIEHHKITAIWLHGGDAQRWLSYAQAFIGADLRQPIVERQDLAFLGLLALRSSNSVGPVDPVAV
ncbi:MAG: type III pantothenate kinase [Betaproteobacteria bacterium]|nr:type III pantothenate kinase [Betaproteobacteria bacterium]